MSIGITPNLGGLNQQAGQIVLNARNALQQILFFNDYLQSLGADGLTAAPLQMDATDAANMLQIFANLATIANACMGEDYTGPALPFDFMASTVPMWGGL
jgi:hypothetical protein